jgi:hypothetical protein
MIAVVTTAAGHRIANELACVQPRSVLRVPPRPKLKTTQIPTLIYAIALTVLRTLCLDLGWNRLANGISAYKFGLFPELRRWQINKWVAQFRRQNLFPNANESELREWAKDLVLGFLI